MDSYEAARRYMSGQMDVDEYTKIVTSKVEQSNAVIETVWANLARKEWRNGFWTGVWLSVTALLFILALLATIGTIITIGR